jgi:DNA-binding NarL/FixJ family response regulator
VHCIFPALKVEEGMGSEGKKKRIVIAEDYRILREGLRPLLSSYPEIDLVGEAENGQAANRCVEKLKADS